MSSDECEDVCPTLHDTNAAKNEQLLPAKSRERYITIYENFITWQNEKNTSFFSEDVLMAYFEEIATKYKPTSLWAMYSMLKLGLKSNHGVNMEQYVKLSAFLRKLSEGYVCKKPKALTIENVEKFIDEAPDYKYLATKVALIFAVTGGLTRQELSEITTNDVENHGEVFLIKVPHTKHRIQGSFVIQGKYHNIIKKYQSLRTEKKGVSTRFFQQFRNGKCRALVIGKNRFGMMPREIAAFLNLPDAKDYTGHSFRIASATTPNLEEFNSKRHEATQSNVTEHIDESVNSKEQDEDSKSNTGTEDPLETKPDEAVQCRFCGQFSNDCVAVSGHMPYLAGHKTALAINHIRIELDFSNHSLPTTVCRHCDAKLHEICEFVKQVNTAQFSLVTVSQNVNTQIVKAEFHDKDDIDALTITEEEYVKKTTIKRKSDDKRKNTSKKKAKTKIETEFIIDMDIKEEIIDDVDALTRTKKTTFKRKTDDKGNNTSKKKAKTKNETEFIIDMDIKEEIIDDVKGQNPEYSDTERDMKPSKSELANSALVYRMSEIRDLCNLTTNSGNSQIGKCDRQRI